MEAAAIGDTLRAARLRLGWSREALAFHSGISWSAITQIESGRRRDVRVTSLVALAGALGVTVDHLVGTASAERSILGHRALLYASDDEFLDATAPFLAGGAERDDRMLAVVSGPRIELLRDALGPASTKVTFEDSSRWYRTPIEAVSRYRTYVDDECAAGARWIRVVGEPAVQGASRAGVDVWGRYEALFNVLFAAAPATVLCPYDTRAVPKRILGHVRHAHPELVTGADATANPDYQRPERLVLAG